MKTWLEYLKSGLARKAPEDRIAGGKTYAGIGENLRRHLPFFMRHWKKGALGAGFILINALMAFPMPLVSRFVIDDVILGKQLSLLPWVLLLMAALALFSFVFATRVFSDGPRGVSEHVVRWSYGLTTLVFIVFPDAMTQGFTGGDPNMKFYQRILDYLLITVYSVVGVLFYDAITERLSAWRRRSRGGTA